MLRKLPIGGLARPRPVNSVLNFPLLPRCLLWSSSSLRNVKGTFCESRSIRSSAPSLLCRCPKSFVPVSMMQPRSNTFSSTNHHQNSIVLHSSSTSQHIGLTLEPSSRSCFPRNPLIDLQVAPVLSRESRLDELTHHFCASWRFFANNQQWNNQPVLLASGLACA